MNRVINFHAVRDREWFEQVVLFLKKKYNMISAQEIISYYKGINELKNACLLTVDDGDLTSYDIIYPILKKYDVPAVFFVSPLIAKRKDAINFWFQEIRNCDELWCKEYAHNHFPYINERINSNNTNVLSCLKIEDLWQTIHQCKKEHHLDYLPPQNMTTEQICQIDKEGLVYIGAHTMWHPFLASENDERSKWEIETSIYELSKLLGHPIELFAYPNGRPVFDFGNREIDTLRQTSCQLSFSTYHKGFSREDNCFAIPRFGLTTGSLFFVKCKLLLGNHYNYLRNILLWIRHIFGILKG